MYKTDRRRIYANIIVVSLLSACGSNSSDTNTASKDQQVNSYVATQYDQKEYYYLSKVKEYQNAESGASFSDNYKEIVAPLKEVVANSEVLNQGVTNTCVTLSLTGAVGLLLHNDSSYYDPVCSLNLGNYLYYNNNFKNEAPLVQAVNDDKAGLNYYPSGWKGTTLSLAVEQFKTFGLVHTSGTGVCGFGSFYSQDNSQMIQPTDFVDSADQNISQNISIEIYCSDYDKSVPGCDFNDDNAVNEIVSTIDSGALSLLSYIVYENDSNIIGLDSSHYIFDENGSEPNTWVYNENVKKCEQSGLCTLGGHDVIVFGYIPHLSEPQKSLFVVRNSWGDSSGDEGNYYITFEYVQKMMLAIASIKKQ